MFTRVLNNSPLRGMFRRKFSELPKGPNGKPKESLFDVMQRYALYGSPLITIGLVSACIISFPSFREYAEYLSPSYVEFLRTNVGFDDEDPVKRALEAALEAQLAKSVNVRVKLYNGEDILLTNVDGRKPLHSFVEDYGFYDNRAVRSMEFEDSEDDESALETTTSVHTSNTTERQLDPIASVAYSSSLVDYIYQHETATASSSPPDKGSSSSSVQFEELTRETAIFERYRNFWPVVIQEMKLGGVLDSTSTGNTQSRPPQQKAVQYDERELAKESIAKLQAKLKIYETELKTGSLRDMDTIASDIQRTKSEITTLQRNHINRFYFF